MQIDDVGFGSGQRLDLLVRPDGDDLALSDGDRVGNGVLGIDRQDLAVDQYQISGCLRGSRQNRQQAGGR